LLANQKKKKKKKKKKKAAVEKVDFHVKKAIDAGAKLLTGGKVYQGLIYEPTCLVEPPRDKGIWKEETFGPVVTLVSVKDHHEALQVANDTLYGLSAGVLTNDLVSFSFSSLYLLACLFIRLELARFIKLHINAAKGTRNGQKNSFRRGSCRNSLFPK